MVVFSKNVHPNNLHMFIFLHCCKANSWTDNFLYIWGTSSLFNTILPSLCREICFLATRRELQEIYLCLFSMQHRFSLCRPIYTQIQISVHWKINPNKKTHFFNFQFLATAQGQCFLFMSLLLPSATEKCEQPECQNAQDLETEDSTVPGSDLYLDRNTCSLAALALSTSVPFHFIPFSVKLTFTWLPKKMVDTHTL